MASGSSRHTVIYWKRMINFYCLTEDCHQVCIGEMSIYFSFKVIVAYRTKKGLRICDHDWGPITKEHIEAITMNHSFVTMDKKGFDWHLKDQFCRTIWDLGKSFTLERMGINVSKQCDIGKS